MTLLDRLTLNTDAVYLRKIFGEDSFSSIDIFALVTTQKDYTLIFHPFSTKISGMCFRFANEKIIVVNSDSTEGRQRFSVAHELYHLNYQENLKSIVCAGNLEGPKDDEERNADLFASYFIVPAEALRTYINENLLKDRSKLEFEDIIIIEQYFKMSRQATLIRLLSEGYIDNILADSMKTNVKKVASALGYDINLYCNSVENRRYYTTGSYLRLAELLNTRDLISQGKYEELLMDAYRSDLVFNLQSEGSDIYD